MRSLKESSLLQAPFHMAGILWQARWMFSLQRVKQRTYHKDRSLPNQGVVDFAVVDDGRGQDLSSADNGLVGIKHRDGAARLC